MQPNSKCADSDKSDRLPTRTYLADVCALMKGSMLVVPALQEHVGIIDQISSFIEENHAYKLQQRKEQHMQPSFGGYSQDLMSYWGMVVGVKHYGL